MITGPVVDSVEEMKIKVERKSDEDEYDYGFGNDHVHVHVHVHVNVHDYGHGYGVLFFSDPDLVVLYSEYKIEMGKMMMMMFLGCCCDDGDEDGEMDVPEVSNDGNGLVEVHV